MQRNLFLDALIVLGFWFIVLYLFSGAGIGNFWLYASGVPVIWAVGGLAGGVVGSGSMMVRWFRSRNLGSAGNDAAKATIMARISPPEFVDVVLPTALEPKRDHNYLRGKRKRKSLMPSGSVRIDPADVVEDWEAYEKAHPAYAQAIIAVLQMMANSPQLKASAYDGHGGTTLYEHSINVVRAMREAVLHWEYRGISDSKGRVVVPMQSSDQLFHSFDKDDPILPLVALAHDIGKMECYQLKPSGEMIEIRPNHGTVGAQMLRRVPEIMSLPMKDRDAIILAVEFYHHMNDLPTSRWLGDRVRSLTGLLYQADCLASIQEGDNNAEKIKAYNEFLDEMKARDPQKSEKKTPEQSKGDMKDKSSRSENDNFSQEEGESQGSSDGNSMPQNVEKSNSDYNSKGSPDGGSQALETQSPSSGEDDDEDGEAYVDPLAQMRAISSSTGSNESQKHDVSGQGSSLVSGDEEDDELASRFAKAQSDPPVWSSERGLSPLTMTSELLAEPGRVNGKEFEKRVAWKHGNLVFIYEQKLRAALAAVHDLDGLSDNRPEGHPFTKELMRQLQARRDLVDSFDGMVFSYKRALWHVDMGKTTGKANPKASPVMVVASAKALDLSHLQDATRAPEILAPFWGKSQAIGKKKSAEVEKVHRLELTQKSFMEWVFANPENSDVNSSDFQGSPCWVIPMDAAKTFFDFDENTIPLRKAPEPDEGSPKPVVAPVSKFFGKNSQIWYLSIMEKAN